ncbi:MAG: restriction endonuclease subunit S [Bacteroidaceae bacterium]|nr:restriction endonuclease subunit S [Bacteroidaceae bacterium]
MKSWKHRRIKELGYLRLGKMLTEKPILGFHQRPYLKSKNIDWLKLKIDSVEQMYFSDFELKSLRLRKNDLVISEGGEVGKTALWQDEIQECYIQNSVHKLTLNKECNPKFYLYFFYFLGHVGYFKSIVNLVSIMHLTYEKLRRIEVPVPPLEVQQKMVDYLDIKLSEIDTQVSLLTSKRDAYLRLKKSIINHAVTHGLNPNVKMKDSGIEWIGEVPEHWEVKRMKDIFFERKELSLTGEEDLLSVSEFYGVARRKDKMNSDEEFESRADSLVGYKICKAHDLVINIMLAWKTGLGISDNDGIVSPAYAVYEGRNIASHFYHYLLRSGMYVKEFKRHSKGIIDSRLRLYNDRFNNISAIYPPLPEQRAIATYLDDKCAKIDTIVSNLNKQISRYGDLKRSLIDEVITGKRAV